MLEIPLSGIKRIEEIAKSSNEYISLSQGAIRIGGIPQQIKDHMQTMLHTDKTDYYESCWGIKPLREKLVEYYSKKHNVPFSVHNMLPTHGCIGGLSLLYLSILSPGDEVIIPEPAYPAYTILTQASRSVPVYVSLYKQTADGGYEWDFDLEKIKAATTEKTKIIIFSNPFNPLGLVLPLSKIKEILAWCEQKGIFLIVDEAYEAYTFTPEYESSMPLVLQSDWLICANTFSKNFAMSGWRIGFMVVPERLNKILAGMQDALLNCLNNTAQYAAIYALDHPELTDYFRGVVLHNRDLALAGLQRLADNNLITFIKPQGSFFLFFKTNVADATDLGMDILNKAKVSLVPGSAFGPSGKPFLRLCYARDTELLAQAMNRILNYYGLPILETAPAPALSGVVERAL